MELRNDLPSVLNRVNRKTVNADNSVLPRISVLKQRIELGNDHRLNDVHSVGDHRPPPSLTIGFDGLRMYNLHRGGGRPDGILWPGRGRDFVADTRGELRDFVHGRCDQEGDTV